MEEVTKKKMIGRYAIAVVVLAVVVIGVAYYLLSGTFSQTVVSGDNVSVYYTGAYTNGTVFDSNLNNLPFTFTVGAGQVIPGFDNAVIGMGINQTKNVTIPVNEAYGPVNPQLIVSIPLNQITSQSNQSVVVGSTITEVTNGRQVRGLVTAVNSTVATVDFNPKLAGHILDFIIRLVAINKKG